MEGEGMVVDEPAKEGCGERFRNQSLYYPLALGPQLTPVKIFPHSVLYRVVPSKSTSCEDLEQTSSKWGWVNDGKTCQTYHHWRILIPYLRIIPAHDTCYTSGAQLRGSEAVSKTELDVAWLPKHYHIPACIMLVEKFAMESIGAVPKTRPVPQTRLDVAWSLKMGLG